MEQINIGRRTLLSQSAAIILGGVAIKVLTTGNQGVAYGCDGDHEGQISSNHGHEAILTCTQLETPGDLSINIQASATHNHVVMLTAADLQQILAGTKVQKISTTTNSHMHRIQFN